MDAQQELDRLTGVLGKALKTQAKARVYQYTLDDEFYLTLGDGDRSIETAVHADTDEAVAELRAILRADTDGAVADVLDELASLSEEGQITAEMLRTMARARRGT